MKRTIFLQKINLKANSSEITKTSDMFVKRFKRMRIVGYFLVIIGVLFGVYLLMALIGITTFTEHLKGEKPSFLIVYYMGIVVAMVVLAVADYLLIRYGRRLIRKAKKNVQNVSSEERQA
ncbi:hypothetical protein [Flavobacterium sp. WV_118_3]|uniref:hypothetical protein n=1 Tax=Flavobacterium sp. WV_118_3 TaxID=3151764 RepID=UPI00321B0F53